MRYLIQPITRLLSRAQARFVRSRAGSVLILVVTLLVLMALIGTAWISTARIDRVAMAQTSANTQIDLLVQGVINLTKSAIVSDLFGTANTYRSGAGYTHEDSHADSFLAARIPYLNNESAIASGANRPAWRSITFPFITPDRIESPVSGNVTVPATASFIPLIGNKDDFVFVPTSVTLNGTPQPALQVYFYTPAGGIELVGDTDSDGDSDADGDGIDENAIILAADTDGDGIADAGLFPLGLGQINGVTYYAAVRVIDNSAAINVSTAWTNATSFDGTGTPVAGLAAVEAMFPTSVGLAQALFTNVPVAVLPMNQGLESVRLRDYRLNIPTPAPANTEIPPWGVVGNVTHTDPYYADPAGNPVARTDIRYLSVGDAMTQMLAQRLLNPGLHGDTDEYQAISSGDGGALAYRYLLKNALASESALETMLAESIFDHGDIRDSKTIFAPSDYVNWFNLNWDFSNLVPRPLRSLLVTRNPLSIATTPSIVGTPYNQTYKSGGIYYPGMAESYAPAVKTSVNMAQFDELWRAYWEVFGFNTAVTPPTAPVDMTAAPVIDTSVTIFRSPLRIPDPASTEELLPHEVGQIRAALAAVNTIDLRDSVDGQFPNAVTPANIDHRGDVTSQQIMIRDTVTGNPKYEVTVFGTEAQPYITEIFVDTTVAATQPEGYVAVELYNPYPYPIPLAATAAGGVDSWQLAIIHRTVVGGYPDLTLTPLTGFAGFVATNVTSGAPAGAVEIPANGYLLLENFNSGVAPAAPSDATARPASAGTIGAGAVTIYVPGLVEVMAGGNGGVSPGGELVLLRPRQANCVRIDSVVPGNTYTETLNLHDLVPVDSFDFTGLVFDPLAVPPTPVWHYVRANGPSAVLTEAGNDWEFVYPGVYTPGAGPRFAATTTGPAAALALGSADPAGIPVNPFLAIQLNNVGWAAGNFLNPAGARLDAAATTPAAFPFGGFARDGDILQVPFIGAYRIRRFDTANPVPTLLAPANAFLELTPVTMDAAFVDDLDLTTDSLEQLGRFAPVVTAPPAAAPPDHYFWAHDLFDYLTAFSPNDDHFPNTDPYKYPYAIAPRPVVNGVSTMPGVSYGLVTAATAPDSFTGSVNLDLSAGMYNGATVQFLTGALAGEKQVVTDYSATRIFTMAGVYSATPAVGDRFKIIAPSAEHVVEGRININTAPWQVLATLPLVIDATGDVDQAQTNQLAKAIVYFRDVDGDGTPGSPFVPHGPFRSIFELNQVVDCRPPAINTAPNTGAAFKIGKGNHATSPNGTVSWNTTTVADDPTNLVGDFSPPDATNDDVRQDFEEQFLVLNRISNLITTRSDSFTAYLQIQGWRNINSAAPELAVQRRAAFIADRTGIISNTTQGQISTTPVPTN